MQGLLSEAMPQEEAINPQGGMSDVDMAVNEAMMGGGMESMGFGVEMASEEEHQKLQMIMDDIESKMHGNLSQEIVSLLENSQTVESGISQAAHSLILGSFNAAGREGIEPSADIYLGENGVIQETVELVYEMADAMGKVTEQPDEVLSAAYFDTLRRVGETMLGAEDPEIRESAQEMLAELELGMPVGPSDYAEEGEMPMEGQPTPMGAEMAQGASQGVSEAPLPPMGPQQGMI